MFDTSVFCLLQITPPTTIPKNHVLKVPSKRKAKLISTQSLQKKANAGKVVQKALSYGSWDIKIVFIYVHSRYFIQFEIAFCFQFCLIYILAVVSLIQQYLLSTSNTNIIDLAVLN